MCLLIALVILEKWYVYIRSAGRAGEKREKEHWISFIMHEGNNWVTVSEK